MVWYAHLFQNFPQFIVKTKIMASGPITSWEIDEETVETAADYFFGLQNHCRWLTAAMKLKDAYSLEGKL